MTKHKANLAAEANATNNMGVSDTFDYLLKRQGEGWPGSRSIKPRNWLKSRKLKAIADA